jgi:hypothetical protein
MPKEEIEKYIKNIDELTPIIEQHDGFRRMIAHGHAIDISYTGSTAPPDQIGGQACSRCTEWIRIDEGEWMAKNRLYRVMQDLADLSEDKDLFEEYLNDLME